MGPNAFGLVRVVRALRTLPVEREAQILDRLFQGDGRVYVESGPRGAMLVTRDELAELVKRFVTSSSAIPGTQVVGSELGRARWQGRRDGAAASLAHELAGRLGAGIHE